MKYQVIIIGGGPAGYTAAEAAGKAGLSVLLIEKNNLGGVCLNEGCIPTKTLLYSAKTYDSARHSSKYAVNVSEVSFDLPKIIARKSKVVRKLVLGVKAKLTSNNVAMVTGEAQIIDKNTVRCGEETYNAENLILCTGSETFIPPITGVETVNYWTHRDALDSKELPASLAIVGGGATGIELAGALADMRKCVLPQDYPDLNINEMRIILLDGSSRLLSAFSEESSKEVADYLKKRDVEIKLNQRVMGYENYQLALNDGTAIDTKNVFWVAGVKANSLQGLPADAYGPGNRLKVDTYNRLSQYPNIFAIGDTALMISEEYPKGHPQVVQPAIQQARNLIRNLQRAETGLPLQPFIYQNKGSMATIGRNHAVVELKKLRFGGFPAWAVWLFIHLMSIVGVKNRLFIFVDWMWSYFTYDPSLRIIIKPLKRE